MREMTIESWLDALYSKAPVPGGGGASAVAGALAACLGGMVANLTTGKKKYAQYQADIERLLEEMKRLQTEFLSLMEEDAAAFEPLSQAYALPKATPEEAAHKEAVLEAALKAASVVPLRMMLTTVDMAGLLEELAEKGSRIALSDVGVALMMSRSALTGASMNVYINTKLMKDRICAAAYEAQADELVEKGCALIDTVYQRVLEEIRA